MRKKGAGKGGGGLGRGRDNQIFWKNTEINSAAQNVQ